ncbi:MAG: hypothetical protein F4089_10665, partial [Gammaproteobacteria bacterium]|nr:hypothetical protein [Gammaproteobacteria bacterium]
MWAASWPRGSVTVSAGRCNETIRSEGASWRTRPARLWGNRVIDPRRLRVEIRSIAERLRRRGVEIDVGHFEKLEGRRKELQADVERLRNERRSASKRIGAAKAAGEEISPLVAAAGDLGTRLGAVSTEFDQVRQALDDFAKGIPNPPDDSVPPGDGEDDNVELRRWREAPE